MQKKKYNVYKKKNNVLKNQSCPGCTKKSLCMSLISNINTHTHIHKNNKNIPHTKKKHTHTQIYHFNLLTSPTNIYTLLL